jgi:four helix bundle protein
MNDAVDQLRVRTKRFALDIIGLCGELPASTPGQVIGKQIVRSGTSVGAHHREGVRARSDAEFISKLEGALQELEETSYWLELLQDANIAPAALTEPLLQEANELAAMLVASVRTVKTRQARRSPSKS